MVVCDPILGPVSLLTITMWRSKYNFRLKPDDETKISSSQIHMLKKQFLITLTLSRQLQTGVIFMRLATLSVIFFTVLTLSPALNPGNVKAENKSPAYRVGKAIFERGIEMFKAGRYEECAIAFQASYSVYPKPVALYNAANCQVAADDYSGAIITLNRYLALPDTKKHEQEARMLLSRAMAETSGGQPGNALPETLAKDNIPESINKLLDKNPSNEKSDNDNGKEIYQEYGPETYEGTIDEAYEECLWLYIKATGDTGTSDDAEEALECLTDLEDDEDFANLDKDQQKSVLKMENALAPYIDSDTYSEEGDEGAVEDEEPLTPEDLEEPDTDEEDDSGAQYLRGLDDEQPAEEDTEDDEEE